MTDYDESVPEQARAERVIEALGREPLPFHQRIRECQVGEIIPHDEFCPMKEGTERIKFPMLKDEVKATLALSYRELENNLTAITFEKREAGWVRID